MLRLHGIPNCDSVKKARRWLDARGIAYAFHDFRKEGADPQSIARWIDAAGIDAVLNRRGTTWRALGEGDRARAADSREVVSLLVQHPSLIKRPVAEHGASTLVGFKDDEWDAHFS